MTNTRRRNNHPTNDDDDDDDNGPRATRERTSRAVAEREASRLARPDRPSSSSALGHASRSMSSVMSTPFGQHAMGGGARGGGGVSRSPDFDPTGSHREEEWCGPYSVARQMIAAREGARRLREERLAENGTGCGGGEVVHPLDGMTEIALERKRRLENPSMNWTSRRKRVDNDNAPDDGDATRVSYYSSRRERFNQQKMALGNGGSIVSLFKLCVNSL
jgi:hypothetical protein